MREKTPIHSENISKKYETKTKNGTYSKKLYFCHLIITQIYCKMKRINYLINLAVILVCTITVSSCCDKQNKGPQKTDAEIVLNNIATRVSVRSYTDQPVEAEKIESMLRAGMAAPSAVNKQPWHFVVVTDREQLNALSQANPHAKMLESAPLAIIVCGNMEKTLEGNAADFWIQDCSAATENILLAAHAMGLGAVWTGLYPGIERCFAVSEVIGSPEYIVPLSMIVIGYPDSENTPKDKWNTDNISYNHYGNLEKPVVGTEVAE